MHTSRGIRSGNRKKGPAFFSTCAVRLPCSGPGKAEHLQRREGV